MNDWDASDRAVYDTLCLRALAYRRQFEANHGGPPETFLVSEEEYRYVERYLEHYRKRYGMPCVVANEPLIYGMRLQRRERRQTEAHLPAGTRLNQDVDDLRC